MVKASRGARHAEPLSEAQLVGIVERTAESGRGSARAAQWLLERQWPERWSVKRKPEKAEPDEPEDPLLALDDELAARRRNPGPRGKGV